MNEYDKNDIRRLLELYYGGEASENDECRLREYFAQPDTDSEFDDDKMFFEALAGVGDSIEVPAELAERLSDAVDLWQDSERTRRRFRFRRFSFRPAIGIAASVAVVFVIGLSFLDHPVTGREPVDTFSDPMEAYAETQRVLTIFSRTIDKSVRGIETAERSSDKALSLAIDQLDKI